MKKNWRTEIIRLYDEYIENSVKERTIMMTCLDEKSKDYGKQLPTLFKGDFDGFIDWLRTKNFLDTPPIKIKITKQ